MDNQLGDCSPPNSKASYVITATDALAAIPSGSHFRVLVFDSGEGDFAGQSGQFSAEMVRPAIANPDFKWWTLDASSGKQVPCGWKLSLVNTEDHYEGMYALDQTLVSGLQMRLNCTPARLGPQQLALGQRLLFNETNLQLVAFQPFLTNPGKVMLGARVTDGTHLLFFVLSSLAVRKTVATYPENTTVTIPIAPYAWSSIFLDNESVWKSQGWSEPNTVDFSLYIEADFNGYYYASIKEISQATS